MSASELSTDRGWSRRATAKLNQRGSPWFVALAVVAATSVITANVIAVKVIAPLGLTVPGGAVVYPLAFIVGDVVTEVYGYGAARRVIWLGFVGNLLFVGASLVVQVMPAPEYWDAQAAYERILGSTPRLLVAGILAYLVGDFANAVVMSRMKLLTSGRALWSRTIVSTLVGQGLDSAMFVSIAFGGVLTWAEVGRIAATVWVFKTVYETLATPITYVVVNTLKRVEALDTYDHSVRYSPFSFSER